MRSIALAIALITAFPAFGADGPWTPAPTPNMGVNDHVPPVERTGQSTGSAQDAPFSGMPAGNTEVNDTVAPDPSAK